MSDIQNVFLTQNVFADEMESCQYLPWTGKTQGITRGSMEDNGRAGESPGEL